MCGSFVHLHNHTEYSLLDGANRIPDLVRRAKELGMPAMAISDHGVMFGCMEFYFECLQQGVKPILGMEAYVAPNGRHKRTGREENETRHLLLLARNEEGYRNLCRLHSVAAIEGFYYKPRIDHEILREHARGLIASTTCIGSEVNQALLAGKFDEALSVARTYKEMFDEGCYFVELQDHGIPEQREMNEGLVKIAKELKLPLVATNDVHFLCQTDAVAHDVLLCIGLGKQRDDASRIRFTGNEYVKTRDEMAALFPQHPEAIENTLMIAEMCDIKLGNQRAMMPDPDLPAGATAQSHLRTLATAGLQDRVRNADDRAWERLEYELGVIETTGFDSYFLLVKEFAQFTRDQGIHYGVRGSAAGSLVSYALGITDVNPLEYDLTFERFLNPERISLPDIDLDFEDARRDEVIRYVAEKYGTDRVAQIVTFGTLGAKAAIKDAGRVMGDYLPQETDRICKLLPTRPGVTLSGALEKPLGKTEDSDEVRLYKETTEFRELYERDPRVQKLVDTARSIEGLSRHSGVHAAGIVISRDPLAETIPLYRGNDGQAITAYEMGILEKIGLLKMDFLGLSNLTVLARTIENIRQTHPDPKRHPVLLGGVEAIPQDDAKTFKMLGRGETVGVFQLESGGMRRNIYELKPQSVRELAAMVALYRPGPIDHIPEFVASKFGRREITHLHPLMAPILEETYGVIVYQDQVLKLVQALAGFSLGKADVLRRAIGKKDLKAIEGMQVEFMSGCADNGVDEATAEAVWKLLLPFAGYAFNKAHAVCYAIIAYQTAYLKANYPVEYMAALLAVYRTKEDRVTTFIEECRRQKISVLPPDVNASSLDFTIERSGKRPAIRFGLAAIKGVGDSMVEAILAARARKPFTHLFEFCEHLRPAGLNRVSVEALIKAGALDSVDRNRKKLLEQVDGALAFADIALKQRLANQDSLFGEGAEESNPVYPALPEAPMADRNEILAMEKETMGIYVSDHPLRGYEHQITTASSHPCASVPDLEDGHPVRLAGVVIGLQERVTRQSGERMATFLLEDLSGQIGCTVFAKSYATLRPRIEKDRVVVVKGNVSHRERPGSGGERTVEVRVGDVRPLGEPAQVCEDDSVLGSVVVRVHSATRPQLEALRRVVESHPGAFEVMLQFGETATEAPMVLLHRIDPRNGFSKAVREIGAHMEVTVVERDPDAPGGPDG